LLPFQTYLGRVLVLRSAQVVSLEENGFDERSSPVSRPKWMPPTASFPSEAQRFVAHELCDVLQISKCKTGSPLYIRSKKAAIQTCVVLAGKLVKIIEVAVTLDLL
jgi:hypothetical protein